MSKQPGGIPRKLRKEIERRVDQVGGLEILGMHIKAGATHVCVELRRRDGSTFKKHAALTPNGKGGWRAWMSHLKRSRDNPRGGLA